MLGNFENKIDARFGLCECGAPLKAMWYIAKECNKYEHETGRVKNAVDYLYCPECGRTYIVDDSFDGPWQYKHY